MLKIRDIDPEFRRPSGGGILTESGGCIVELGVGGVGVGVGVVDDTEVLAHVAEGLFGDGEFTEMVAPDVFAGAAPGVSLAGDGSDGSVCFTSLKGLGGDLEGDLFAGLPEVRRELMREEKDVVSALLGEGLDGLGDGGPGEAEFIDVPLAKFEAVDPCLSDEEMEELEFCHDGGFCEAALVESSPDVDGFRDCMVRVLENTVYVKKI